MITNVAIVMICLAAAQVASAEDNSFDDLKRMYDYDRQQALDVQEKILHERDGVKVYDLSYASPKGGKVTAYMVVPEGKGPFAGLLFGHWGPGNRTEFLPEATLYARAGAVSLLIDYPWVRPAPWRKSLKEVENPEWDHQAFVQAVIDLRRGIDLLSSRPDIDPKRIAYVGHSFGAQWGAILSAVDDRLKGVVAHGRNPRPGGHLSRQQRPGSGGISGGHAERETASLPEVWRTDGPGALRSSCHVPAPVPVRPL